MSSPIRWRNREHGACRPAVSWPWLSSFFSHRMRGRRRAMPRRFAEPLSAWHGGLRHGPAQIIAPRCHHHGPVDQPCRCGRRERPAPVQRTLSMAGSTYGLNGQHMTAVSVAAAIFCALALLLIRWPDVVPLGETVSRALDVRIATSRALMILTVAGAVATLVVGPTTFVGLLARRSAGRLLFPGRFRPAFSPPSSAVHCFSVFSGRGGASDNPVACPGLRAAIPIVSGPFPAGGCSTPMA